ncbi:ROK family protein [Candidatus Nitronereus thalassa]|uniref:ROK family protein n=1 Tax=Candidatus Nitronereus thalassa TaxID=3020898 RepID=A0ABU3K713_9BACT|nr:ROK family protein [Candidatus Nitronereus thalassa]MDT7042196.1 ROK family protein [Candidatus Nitronereus thalassa]
MRIGVDVGGTKIEAILLDSTGEELARRRRDSPQGNYEATLVLIDELVEELERDFGVTATVGVGIPGTISPATGLVKNANSTWLTGHPFQHDLARCLNRTIKAANDADCFVVSESTDGAAQGARSVFGVILGTGVGGGLCWEGRPIVGPNAIAGEWGHNPLPWPKDDERPGPECYCGLRGCLETFLSGPGMINDHFQRTGEHVTPQEIYSRALGHDFECLKTLERYEHRLARGLASVINIFDPEVIVLGGGMSNIDRWYHTVPTLWGAWVFSDRVDTRLETPRFGDSSGVRGAAWLWPLE